MGKLTGRVPAKIKRQKVRVVSGLYGMHPRDPLTNDIDEESLEDIEDLPVE